MQITSNRSARSEFLDGGLASVAPEIDPKICLLAATISPGSQAYAACSMELTPHPYILIAYIHILKFIFLHYFLYSYPHSYPILDSISRHQKSRGSVTSFCCMYHPYPEILIYLNQYFSYFLLVSHTLNLS